MRFIKKIDLFVLKTYLLLFLGTFFVCLFIFMMQFMWRYVDDLVGKGLPVDVLIRFFYYASLTLVPMALPLAILLASLITFGNLGEQFELLAMKAAGIPLVRIIQPIFIFVVGLSIASFYFQNITSPEATRQLATLVFSMKQKSPELEIPEGTFYNEIPGYNLFVKSKSKTTGMLYDVMIYSNTDGYEDAQIVLADSAKLQSTADKTFLMLTLYNGERFQNMQTQGGTMSKANVPYLRETFIKEVDLIPFNANFNMMDASLLSSNAATKSLKEIEQGIDSLNNRIDSIGHATYSMTQETFMARALPKNLKDTVALMARAEQAEPFDSIFAKLRINEKQEAIRTAIYKARSGVGEYDFRALISNDSNRSLRLHWVEWNKKFTLSVACLIFFFIGAPLGAIIRKGGLGLPVVVSVVIFIFYYMVNGSGEKMAKSGEWLIGFGLWLSSFVLFPIGAFLTYKANKDSVVFNMEGYVNVFRRILGLRISRHINRKEVIINDPDYPQIRERLYHLALDCKQYSRATHLKSMPNYFRLYFRYKEDTAVIQLNEIYESIIEELCNSRDHSILGALNSLPILSTDAHTRPFHNSKLNIATGLLFPLGAFFFFRIWLYRLRLWKDMQNIQKYSKFIIERIDKILVNEQTI